MLLKEYEVWKLLAFRLKFLLISSKDQSSSEEETLQKKKKRERERERIPLEEIKGEKLLKLEEQGQACPPDMRGIMFLFPSNKLQSVKD